MTTIITEPCLRGDIPEDEYHADPVQGGSLSSTGAKTIYPPGGPAKFDYQRRHGGKKSKAMDLGTVVHGIALGTGQPVRVLDFPNWTTNKAREAKQQAIADGCVPMLTDDYTEAQAITQAILDHEVTGGLFAPGGFDAEVSMFWRDEEFGIWCRGRLDAMANIDSRVVIGDLKTAADASAEGFAKAVERYSYYMQEVHYRTGLAILLGCDPDDIDFLFAVVETEPPYWIAVYDTEPWRELGTECCRIAYEKYAGCSESGIWPGYDPCIHTLEVPRPARYRIESGINDWYDHAHD
jgi:hypothetical protein